jgi:transcriptional regulator with XRE-family HTH domain
MSQQQATIIELPVLGSKLPPADKGPQHERPQHEPLRILSLGLGDRVRAARQAAKLSLKHAGEKIGVSDQTVLNWETGTRVPDKANVRRMAEIYGVASSWLAAGEGSGPAIAEPYRPYVEGRPNAHTRDYAPGLNDRLFTARRVANISTEVAGKQMGVSPQSVSKWETGDRVPNKRNLKLLAEVYAVEPRWLVTGQGYGPTVAAYNKMVRANPKRKFKPERVTAKRIDTSATLIQQLVHAHIANGKRVIIEGNHIILEQ